MSASPSPPPVCLSLVVSGAVSLGAYEAGAIAQLAQALDEWNENHHEPWLAVDVIAGASAGAMTGAMLAHHLMTGTPVEQFVRQLRQVWTQDSTSLDRLLQTTKSDRYALLSSAAIAETGRRALPEASPGGGRIPRELVLTLTLTNLQGSLFNVSLWEWGSDGPPPRPALRARTYRDWITFRFTGDGAVEEVSGPAVAGNRPADWQRVLWAALASGAFPFAFQPVRLTRRLEDYPDAVGVGEITENTGTQYTYTDGGVLDNQPLKRAIEATETLPTTHQRGVARLYLMIEPNPPRETDPACVTADIQAADGPSIEWPWTRLLAHLYAALREQSVYLDLHESQKVNQRLTWRDEGLLPLLHDLVRSLPPERLHQILPGARDRAAEVAEFKHRQAGAPQGTSSFLEEQLRRYREEDTAPLAHLLPEQQELLLLLTFLVDNMAGLRGKRRVYVARVHPEDAEQELAGEFLGHFGGFLDRRFREHDFARGARDMHLFLTRWIAKHAGSALPLKPLWEQKHLAREAFEMARVDLADLRPPVKRRYLGAVLRGLRRLALEELEELEIVPRQGLMRMCAVALLALMESHIRLFIRYRRLWPALMMAGLPALALLGVWKLAEVARQWLAGR
ncbi:MAG: patatin-like phospholipase family protein [Armatimonadetes bacterium]|nr:patatin-like phospholipase family protein [Armatimonadota bacterium]